MILYSNQRGFTLVEVIVSISIFIILATLVFLSASSFRATSDLSTTVSNVIADLRFLQSQTIASKNESQYGIKIEQDKFTLFKGSSYSTRDTSYDEVRDLPSRIDISSWSVGGGDEVVFERVSGSTNNAGSITLGLKSDPSIARVVVISASGEIFISGPAVTLSGTRVTDTRHVHYTLGWGIENASTSTLYFSGPPAVSQEIPIPSNTTGGKFSWSGTINVNGSDQQLTIHTHLMTSVDTILSVIRPQDENDESIDISIDGNLITSYDDLGVITLGPFGGTMEVQ